MDTSLTIEEGKSGTKYRWAVLVLCFLLYLFDNYVMFIPGLTMSNIVEALGTDSAGGGLISSATMLGAVIGCVLTGRIASTWGSRNTLTAMGIIIGVASFVCALSTSFWVWIVLRIIVGVGVGSMLGPCVKLAADHWGPKHRRMATAAILCSFSIAGLVASFVTKMLIGFGYAYIYEFAAIAIIPSVLLLFMVPSDKLAKTDLESNGNEEVNVGFSSILDGNLKYVTIFGIMVSFFNMAGAWAMGTWIPSWLINVRGLSVDLMTNFSMVNYLGGFVGYFFWSWIGNKMGTARALIVGYIATAVAMVLYLLIPGTDILFYLGPVLYFCQAMNVLMSITFGEAFPRYIRAYGSSTCFNVGRVGSIISPYTTALVGTTFGLTAGLGMVPVFYGVGALFAGGLKYFVDIQQKKDADDDASSSVVSNIASDGPSKPQME